MQDKEQWKREKSAREECNLDPRYVVGELDSVPSEEDMCANVENLSGGLGAIAAQLPVNIKLSSFTNVIIMYAADRNLYQMFLQERLDLNTVRTILQDVFGAVIHLHKQGLMHGDLKMANIVRLALDNRLRLIDLDASVKILSESGDDPSYSGAKFSSAILPPEMIHELKSDEEREAFEKYWLDADPELRTKNEAKFFKAGNSWLVVKSYREEGGVPVLDGLPYKLVKASESLDTWSIGVMIFTLVTGNSLVPSNRDDDCSDGAAMHTICEWGKDDSYLEDRLGEINNIDARELVRKMLQRDPSKRPTLSSLLKHDYFLDPDIGALDQDDARPPPKIDAALGVRLRDSIIKLIPGGDVERHYPTWVTSYATGHRKGSDGEGCGPGMWLNTKIVKLATNSNVEVPMTGMLFRSGSWKAYKIRLSRSKCEALPAYATAAKVMVVLMTKELYTSSACFDEICLALENDMKFILLRCEEDLPKSEEWWKRKYDDQNRSKVVHLLESSNSIPPPGSTILTAPCAMKSFLDELKAKIKQGQE